MHREPELARWFDALDVGVMAAEQLAKAERL
jgi:hypothetical protein